MADNWEAVATLLAAGVAESVYTAAVLAAGIGPERHFLGAVGRLSQDPQSPPATSATLFDLASLTKPLATTLALLVLLQEGRLSPDATLGEILPRAWLPADKAPLPLALLLTHRAGLPAWLPLYEELLRAPAAARPRLLPRLAAAAPLVYPPGTQTLYSDLGFMLLQAVVEEVSGTDLDTFCRQRLYQPLGLRYLGFRPRLQAWGAAVSYAATEPGLIPERFPEGEAHDENAWAAGGIAGHAGLFGTAAEVYCLAAFLYETYHGRGNELLSCELLRTCLTPAPGADRVWGFDLPAPRGASCGRYFSPQSVGHLGFTGVSCWLDLRTGQICVLLTNRVHLGRNHDRIKTFRPQLHEAVSRALGYEQAYRPG